MGWIKVDSQTATSDTDSLDSPTIDVFETIEIMNHVLPSSTINGYLYFNGDTSTNYARRSSEDGGAEATVVSDSEINHSDSQAYDMFTRFVFVNPVDQAKLGIAQNIDNRGSGDGTAPKRIAFAFKWHDVTNPINDIQSFNNGAGSFAADSNNTIIGSRDV